MIIHPGQQPAVLERPAPGPRLRPGQAAPKPVRKAPDFLAELVCQSLVLAEDLDALPDEGRQQIAAVADVPALLAQLVQHGLLTNYQCSRIEAGTTFGLVLGQYRVLDRLGAGGMGVVFRGEHILMRKQVAIKVLALAFEHDTRLLNRFRVEIRAVAKLQHPNIVAAIDVGSETSLDASGTTLHYFVMEYVSGQDLEELVQSQGPLDVTRACHFMYQVASALAEAHKHGLVHRDIKPSNIQIAPDGQAKLLDFGLVRHFGRRLTESGAVLGTIDYMAPEQAQDARTVDIRADFYALGGVLFWCLSGCHPFPAKVNILQDLAARQNQQPPSVCDHRPDVPVELDRVLQRLMALAPDDRPASPQEVLQDLAPFLRPASEARPAPAVNMPLVPVSSSRIYQILLVDDEPSIRGFCRFSLQDERVRCDEASGGAEALRAVRGRNYDLMLLDVNMPDVTGPDVCRQLREHPASPNLKIILTSGLGQIDTMASMLLAGADDFVTKPFSVTQLQARVKTALRLKDAQDRSDSLHHRLYSVNHELEQALAARSSDLVDARNVLVLSLAKLVEHRGNETGGHLTRLQKYVRCLAEEALRLPAWNLLDGNFVDLVACCAPLHDIGKVGLPDHILLKPGKLDPDERAIMEAHTLIGAETLLQVAKNHASAKVFLDMATAIVRSHHERFDGTGYPDRLAGQDIPLPARLVAICDVYDALRSRTIYKPALSHSAALQVMTAAAGSQFDPDLMQAFLVCAPHFERTFADYPD